MSAVPRHPSDFGYAGLRMTADQFLSLDETRERYELVDGVVIMSPSATPLHQALIGLILYQLHRYAQANDETHVFHEVDWRLGPGRVYAPDVVCYAPGRLPGIPDKIIEPPDLIVEVLSPGTKAFDLTTKRADYEDAGVAEYWAIDPADLGVRCFRHQAGAFAEYRIQDSAISSTALPGFILDLKPLRAIANPH